jgi:hypothetical protein
VQEASARERRKEPGVRGTSTKGGGKCNDRGCAESGRTNVIQRVERAVQQVGRAENKRAGCGYEPRVLEAGAGGMRETRAGVRENGTKKAGVRAQAGGQPHTPIKCARCARSKQGPRSAMGCVVMKLKELNLS